MTDENDPSAPSAPAPRPRQVLRPGARFDGLLYLSGPGRIDGTLRGEILADRAIWVGETGSVQADLEADEIVVAGAVEGDIRAHQRIELQPTARVRGALHAPRLVLAEGCFVEGACEAGAAGDRVGEAPPADAQDPLSSS